MEQRFETARLPNLENLGFPISRVISTRNVQSDISPKADALRELAAVAFVDDFLRGIPKNIHGALVLREPNGSPNEGSGLDHVDSQHVDLADFARWWLNES